MKINKKTTKTDRKIVTILGITIDSTRLSRVLTSVEEKISDNVKFYITTPNPELVLASAKNERLKNALNNSDFSIPDGVGLAQAAKFLSFKSKNQIIIFVQGLFVGLMTLVNKKYLTSYLEVIHGRILFDELVELAAKKNWKVFLLGGLDNEAEIAAERLRNMHYGLAIDSLGGNYVKPELTKAQIKVINDFKPDLLFVALGNPAQEIFMYENKNKLNAIGMMAVGGTFRYIAGMSILPPRWIELIGLEWLWRLITEPYRLKRVFNAVVVFPLKVWMSKFKKN